MTVVTVKNRPLCGCITAPPSKSLSHRALILCALSGGRVLNCADCDDVRATQRCLAAMKSGGVMDAGGSATTLRLLIPLALLTGGGRFLAGGSLRGRPLDAFERLGIAIARRGGEITVSGRLTGGEYSVDAAVSSQFASGLLMALPLINGDSRLRVVGAASAPYIRLTLDVMRAFGVTVYERDGAYDIPGGQSYKPCEYAVEGDWSYAANFVSANALGGQVTVNGLNAASHQGDRAIGEMLACRRVSVQNTPDLLPVLMAAACACSGDTVFYDTSRLKYKESDRPQKTAAQLRALGADISLNENSVTVHGHGGLVGGSVQSDDHRVVMALAIAAAICTSPVTIDGAEAVTKSAPQFFNDIAALGG